MQAIFITILRFCLPDILFVFGGINLQRALVPAYYAFVTDMKRRTGIFVR